MFYHNTKYRFALAEMSPDAIAGGVIAAAAMPRGQLMRRDMRKSRYLQHRLLDPQVYLAGLDPNVAGPSIVNLASWPWFGESGVPEYDSDTHGSLARWKETYQEKLLKGWPGAAPSDEDSVRRAVIACIVQQVDFGCEAILLPTPLTNVVAQNFEAETQWLDLGLEACERLQVALPIYATVAVSDNVLRGINPTENPLLHTITNQISSRSGLAGAYVVIEQASEDSYVCAARDTLLSLLLLVDDLARGAARRVIVNYMGTFGAVVTAVGPSIWSTGYYLSQRRFRLGDYEENEGRAYPRFYSVRLAGDVGLQHDLKALQVAGLSARALHETKASQNLLRALAAGKDPSAVAEWQYKVGNVSAAAAHYNELCFNVGADLSALDSKKRVDLISWWLEKAVELAEVLKGIGIAPRYTDIAHQKVWLDAFERWKSHAGG